MQNIEVTMTYPATPDALWAIVGSASEVENWVPAVAESRLDGDIRCSTFEGGGEARERITQLDRSARVCRSEYLDGSFELRSWVSNIAVTADGDGARVSWTAELEAVTEGEEQSLASTVSGIYGAALAELLIQVQELDQA